MSAGEEERAREDLLQEAPIVAFRLDAALRITAWNDFMGRLFGCAREQAIGRQVTEIIVTEAGVADWDALLRSPSGTRRVWPTQDLAGRPLRVAFIVQPLAGGGGAMIFGRDLTAEHAAEQARRELIERQQRALRQLGTPIIEVWERVLALPIIGAVDDVRAGEIMETLLASIVRVRARFAILDLTGVGEIDASTAGHLVALVRAIRLLGAEGILTGLSPLVADALVHLGVELAGLTVRASLREALRHCIPRLGQPPSGSIERPR